MARGIRTVIFLKKDFFLFKEGKLVKLEKELVDPRSKYLVIIPRSEFLVDKITLPEIALEDGKEVALYQAQRIFKAENLVATLYQVERKNGQIECLLIALKHEYLEEIKKKAEDLLLNIFGISMATLIYPKIADITEGGVYIRWDEGIECARISKGIIKDVFFIPNEEKELFNALKKSLSPLIEVNLSELQEIPFRIEPLFKQKIEHFEEKRASKLKLLVRGLLLFIIISGILLITKISTLKGEIHNLKLEKEKLKDIVSKTVEIRKESEKLKKELTDLKKIKSGLKPVKTIALIVKNLPTGTIFNSMRMEKNRIDISGYTESISKLIENLGKIPFVKDVKIRSSVSEIKTGKYQGKSRFYVTLEITSMEDKAGNKMESPKNKVK